MGDESGNESGIDFNRVKVAYFSMEIGIAADIPTYSGGLGVLAGDTLRSAADLELPMIGITLIYQKGYFRQKIDGDGNQHEEDRHWKPEEHLEKLPYTTNVQIEGRDVKIGCWLYKLKGITGKENPIIFLDTDLEGNSDYDRTITHHLYGNDKRYRFAQEIVLGIGGKRIIKEMGCKIDKHHMNEGHSALLSIELYKELNRNRDEVRNRCVFTTHTPVPAGHDAFDSSLVMNMLRDYLDEDIGKIIFNDNLLNMTYLGLQFSEYVNGVAKKHGEISRGMFPGYDIDSITNGIHSAYWVCPHFKKLFDEYVPNWESDPFSLRYVLGIPRNRIWDTHMEAKKELISFINEKYGMDMDAEVFTIGFARRAATYKRGDMLLTDPDRLIEIAKNSGKVQIIFGGKAHPSDGMGKDIIRRIVQKSKAIAHEIKVCYVEDYGIEIAKKMVSGVDLWLNTPLRPKEASGTSGMKAAHNGVPQFSVLDGWWIEGHIENKTGWSIGAHPHMHTQNDHEEDVDDMYTKLEYVILPMFYNSQDKWQEIMRNCIAINGSFFNTHRMVQQYVLNAYFY
jgi:starch phosphorylase